MVVGRSCLLLSGMILFHTLVGGAPLALADKEGVKMHSFAGFQSSMESYSEQVSTLSKRSYSSQGIVARLDIFDDVYYSETTGAFSVGSGGRLSEGGRFLEERRVELSSYLGGWLFSIRKEEGHYGVSYFVGYGFRYWQNDPSESEGYYRELFHYHLPFGFKIKLPIESFGDMTIRLEGKVLHRGIVKNYLHRLDVSARDVTLYQNSGWGGSCSIGLNQPFYESLSLSWEGYFRYWNISKSTTEALKLATIEDGIMTVYEPSNSSMELGLRVSIYY